MGFLTDYQITLEDSNKEKLSLLKQKIEEFSGYDFHIKDGVIHINDSSKWYDHPDHLIQLSSETEFKDLLITANCFCSEAGESWRFYAKNGKGYKSVPIEIIPDFNERRLENQGNNKATHLPYNPESLIILAEEVAKSIKLNDLDKAAEIVNGINSIGSLFLVQFLQGTYITDIPMIDKDEMKSFLDFLKNKD